MDEWMKEGGYCKAAATYSCACVSLVPGAEQDMTASSARHYSQRSAHMWEASYLFCGNLDIKSCKKEELIVSAVKVRR